VPLGANAEASDDGVIKLTACIATLDGRRVIRESQSGMMDDPKGVAEALETILVSRGAREILDACRPRSGRAKPHRNGQSRRPKARRPKARPRRTASRHRGSKARRSSKSRR
jgi:hypothetical protein